MNTTTRLRVLGIAILTAGLLGCSGGDPEPDVDVTTRAAATATETVTPQASDSDDPAAAGDVLVSTDGSFQAAVPEGFIDIRVLLDEDERDVALGDLGVELPEGDISDMVAGMSLGAIPWLATDIVRATPTFAPTVNIVEVPGAGGTLLADMVDAFNAQNGGFGEIPSGDRRVEEVAGIEAIVYEYTQVLSDPEVEVRGTQVAIHAGDDLYLITYASPDETWDNSVVPTIARSLEPVG